MLCWCSPSCCAASTYHCATSIRAWSSPRRASARRHIACSAPSRCPCCCPALVGGWLFAAILSFNEFTASLFVTAQRTQTLPVALYNYVREYADPSMAAVSVIYIVVVATLLTLANAFLGLGKVLTLTTPAEVSCSIASETAAAPDARTAVELAGVSKRFGNVTALDDVSLAVCRGELMTLLGPSGCGKTSLLNLIAGFLLPDQG